MSLYYEAEENKIQAKLSKLKCKLCGNALEQSKNDSELYCCYPCGVMINKSEMKVSEKIVPKREANLVNYPKDEMIEAGIISDASASKIYVEPDTDVKKFTLTNPNSQIYLERELELEVEKIRIRDNFRKMFNNENIKIEYAR